MCQSICTSGRERKARNLATPLYTLLVLPLMTHSEEPPMTEFCGAPFTSSQYRRKVTDQAHFAAAAARQKVRWRGDLRVLPCCRRGPRRRGEHRALAARELGLRLVAAT